MAFKSYREHSKINYGKDDVSIHGEGVTLEQLNAGSFQRIADATEKMAGNYIKLQNERDWYERYYKQEKEATARMSKRIAALQGVINRYKKTGAQLKTK
jgi:hypothetical protein